MDSKSCLIFYSLLRRLTMNCCYCRLVSRIHEHARNLNVWRTRGHIDHSLVRILEPFNSITRARYIHQQHPLLREAAVLYKLHSPFPSPLQNEPLRILFRRVQGQLTSREVECQRVPSEAFEWVHRLHVLWPIFCLQVFLDRVCTKHGMQCKWIVRSTRHRRGRLESRKHSLIFMYHSGLHLYYVGPLMYGMICFFLI